MRHKSARLLEYCQILAKRLRQNGKPSTRGAGNFHTGDSMKKIILLVVALGLVSHGDAWAKRRDRGDRWRDNGRNEQTQQQPGQLPNCPGAPSVNNEQVLQWKESTQSGYTGRAFVQGVVVGTLVDRGSHLHLEIDLSNVSNTRSDHLEVVYNKQFGEVPTYRQGSMVQACGDYITSTQRNGGYDPSPVGAIIHWIHMSPKENRHPSGFLAIDGQVTGLVNPNDRGARSFFGEFLSLAVGN